MTETPAAYEADDTVTQMLCLRVDELQAEKEALVAQLDRVKEERDALAAHVERLHEALVTCHNAHEDYYIEEHEVRRAMESSPTTSLTYLKAQWQVEALEQLIDDWIACEHDHLPWREFVVRRIDEIRRQAEEGADAKAQDA